MNWLYAGAPMAMAAMTPTRSKEFFISFSFPLLYRLPPVSRARGRWPPARARTRISRLVDGREVTLVVVVCLDEVQVDRVHDPVVVEIHLVLVWRPDRCLHRVDVQGVHQLALVRQRRTTAHEIQALHV